MTHPKKSYYSIKINTELKNLYEESDIVSCIKERIIIWLGDLYRINKKILPKQIMEGCPVQMEKKKKAVLDYNIEADLMPQGVRNWIGAVEDWSE